MCAKRWDGSNVAYPTQYGVLYGVVPTLTFEAYYPGSNFDGIGLVSSHIIIAHVLPGAMGIQLTRFLNKTPPATVLFGGGRAAGPSNSASDGHPSVRVYRGYIDSGSGEAYHIIEQPLNIGWHTVSGRIRIAWSGDALFPVAPGGWGPSGPAYFSGVLPDHAKSPTLDISGYGTSDWTNQRGVYRTLDTVFYSRIPIDPLQSTVKKDTALVWTVNAVGKKGSCGMKINSGLGGIVAIDTGRASGIDAHQFRIHNQPADSLSLVAGVVAVTDSFMPVGNPYLLPWLAGLEDTSLLLAWLGARHVTWILEVIDGVTLQPLAVLDSVRFDSSSSIWHSDTLSLDLSLWEGQEVRLTVKRSDNFIPSDSVMKVCYYDVELPAGDSTSDFEKRGVTQRVAPRLPWIPDADANPLHLTVHPNPFNPTALISFYVPPEDANQHVDMRAVDVLGREVAILVNTTLEEGTYRFWFGGLSLPSGRYYVVLQTANHGLARLMVLLR
jgi:hypothetical protein